MIDTVDDDFTGTGFATVDPRDWTEDASLENGDYICLCCRCGETFVGHKRRVVCRLCYGPAP